MVPSEQILERQILTRVTFAPVLGFNRFRLGFPNPNKSAGINRLLLPDNVKINRVGNWSNSRNVDSLYSIKEFRLRFLTRLFSAGS